MFVGGVSLGQPATSIPIAAIVGIIAGVFVGFVIYSFAGRTSEFLLRRIRQRSCSHSLLALRIFLIIMTNLLLLIGAGLFSKAVGNFERHAFNKLLGGEAGEGQGDGPGTYKVQGNVWHLNCCNPENKTDNQGWSIFAGIFGWNNDATCTSFQSDLVSRWLMGMVVSGYGSLVRLLLDRSHGDFGVHEVQGGTFPNSVLLRCVLTRRRAARNCSA